MIDFDILDDCVPLPLREGDALIEGLWLEERDVRSDCDTLDEREEDGENDEVSDVRELAELDGEILLDAETDVDPV